MSIIVLIYYLLFNHSSFYLDDLLYNISDHAGLYYGTGLAMLAICIWSIWNMKGIIIQNQGFKTGLNVKLLGFLCALLGASNQYCEEHEIATVIRTHYEGLFSIDESMASVMQITRHQSLRRYYGLVYFHSHSDCNSTHIRKWA